MEEIYNKISHFPWESITTLIAIITLFITFWPKFDSWCKQRILRCKLNRFFHDLQPESKWPERLNGAENIQHITIANFQINLIEFENECSITFYKYKKIVFIKCNQIFINGIKLPIGYHPFKIISDVCIRIDFFSENDEYKSAFIFKDNNVTNKNPEDRKNFEKVIGWG